MWDFDFDSPGRIRDPGQSTSHAVGFLAATEWRLQVFAGFVESALGVVLGLQCLLILIDGALALAAHVEDFAELNVAPDLGPLGLAITVEGIAIGVRRGLVVALQEKDLG